MRAWMANIRLGCFLLMLLMSGRGVFAQQPALRLNYTRQNNFTYSTLLDTDYELRKGPYRLELRLHHDHLLNTTRRDNRFVQAYLQSRIWQFFRLKPRWELASWLEGDHFFTGSNYRYNLYAGFQYELNENLRITPLLGYSWDSRNGKLDQGFSPALRVQARYRWPDGLFMETRLFARVKYIAPRHQRNLVFSSMWGRSFGSFANLSFGLQVGSNEMDGYRLASVEKITSDTLAPVFNLRYQFMPRLYWESENRLALTRRRFDYVPYETDEPEFNNVRFDHLDIYTLQKLSYAHRGFSSFLSFTYQQLNRRYDMDNNLELRPPEFERQLEREKEKDFIRQLYQWDLFLNYELGPRHALSLSATNRYVQFDTPAGANVDDNDELNHNLSLEWRTRWSRHFSTQYKLLGNMRHYAFLQSQRSQDNYRQYNLRMDFGFRWDPLRNLSLEGEQFIYVTYNVKDFEDLNLTDRSTRNLESRLILNYRPKPRHNLRFSLYRKEIHVSYLNWEAFTETTLDTTTTYILEGIDTWELGARWLKHRIFLEVGYKHFSLVNRLNTAMNDLDNFLVPINLRIRNLQSGPVTGIRLRRRDPASLELSIWWQLQYQDFVYKSIEDFTSIAARYQQERLDQVEVNFRPFFRLSFNLWLQPRVVKTKKPKR